MLFYAYLLGGLSIWVVNEMVIYEAVIYKEKHPMS